MAANGLVDDTTRYTPARLANHWDAYKTYKSQKRKKNTLFFYIVNIYIYTYLILPFIHSLLTFLYLPYSYISSRATSSGLTCPVLARRPNKEARNVPTKCGTPHPKRAGHVQGHDAKTWGFMRVCVCGELLCLMECYRPLVVVIRLFY